MYSAREFFIQFILVDGKFSYVIDNVMKYFKCHLNCTVVEEYVSKAECAIRVIKECVESIVSTWHFKVVHIPNETILIKFIILWLNSFL